MANQKQTTTEPGAGTAASHEHTTAAPVALTTPAPITRLARFYASESNKGPVARVEVDAEFPGTVHTADIWADKDQRGGVTFRASLPGSSRYGAALCAAPTFVKGADGLDYPVRGTKNPKGAEFENRWNGVIISAFMAATKDATPERPIPAPVQQITF